MKNKVSFLQMMPVKKIGTLHEVTLSRDNQAFEAKTPLHGEPCVHLCKGERDRASDCFHVDGNGQRRTWIRTDASSEC